MVLEDPEFLEFLGHLYLAILDDFEHLEHLVFLGNCLLHLEYLDYLFLEILYDLEHLYLENL